MGLSPQNREDISVFKDREVISGTSIWAIAFSFLGTREYLNLILHNLGFL